MFGKCLAVQGGGEDKVGIICVMVLVMAADGGRLPPFFHLFVPRNAFFSERMGCRLNRLTRSRRRRLTSST
ncbi:hypothetical protein UC8_12390 [Roseimaritima ulvae]|uniref:Uncharacterized protein n=1 Tax=Roseimaritima ulvae TaxID=980254 RepID=A0A5B9QJP6_9BACT|nr:hypothetical protein UC8_12390 [Roseimaritima ulvae]